MMEVRYAGGSFVTSDEVSDALLEYGAALANAERAATVRVPAVGLPDGASGVAVLVGPASQLMAEPVDRQDPELDGSEFIRDVEHRMQSLRRVGTFPVPESPVDWDI